MSNQSKLAALASTGVTKAELNNIDGGTARGTTAVADGDGFLTNDSGTMRMTSVDTLATYMGTKITGGSMVYLASTGAISNAANASFTQFDASKYDHYKFYFQHVIPATDNVTIYAYVSTDGGSNYDTTDGNYHVQGASDMPGYFMANGVGSGTNEFGVGGYFDLFAPHNSNSYTFAQAVNINYQTYIGNIGQQFSSGAHLVAADVDAIQFAFSSGNIESGEIVMYGIANGT